MKFIATNLPGVWLVELNRVCDARGFFARVYCQNEFKKHGLDFTVVQTSLSFNKKRGTLRGLHFQKQPYAEQKIVCCVKGRIFDVAVDIRSGTSTQWQWYGVELENGQMLYLPEGFAHGYQTLTDDTLILYHHSQFYHPEAADGLRWDDPFLKISWPLCPTVISVQDRYRPLLEERTDLLWKKSW
ncbi:MAG: dTDP-4-dehydrorhamnose 3,5-epimerase [Candidatus Omnitrophica bacterium]|nr:dTDP-4-dehydrorhamnose 3,5-epimerase [Candidatus Omnitrophota bacterium]